MALTRKKLSALGIEAEKIDEIIEAHMETVNALKSELDEAKGSSDKSEALKKENEKLKEELKSLKEASKDSEEYKSKYESLNKDFEAFKAKISEDNTKAAKTKAYKSLLAEIGISEKRHDGICKLADLATIELDENGSIKDADSLKKSIQEDWGEFIEKEGVKGADTHHPPKNDGKGKMTKEEILAIKDTAERQQAMYENKELFI